MPTVDATTFRRDSGRYQDEAHREPVKVTNHGRVIGVFLSSHDLEHFEQLNAASGKSTLLARFLTTSSTRSRRLSISSRPRDISGSAPRPCDPLQLSMEPGGEGRGHRGTEGPSLCDRGRGAARRAWRYTGCGCPDHAYRATRPWHRHRAPCDREDRPWARSRAFLGVPGRAERLLVARIRSAVNPRNK